MSNLEIKVFWHVIVIANYSMLDYYNSRYIEEIFVA